MSGLTFSKVDRQSMAILEPVTYRGQASDSGGCQEDRGADEPEGLDGPTQGIAR